MIARFTEPAADCRFSTKVAVPAAGATEFCALSSADEARRANADCHFPSPRPYAHAMATDDDGAPCAPTGADARSVRAEAAAPAPGAASANVARDGANDADPPRVDPPFSPRAPSVPTSVSHQGTGTDMDARTSARNALGPDPETQRRGNGRKEPPSRWSLGAEACVECGLTTSPHRARGLCKRCYDRLLKRRKRGQSIALPMAPQPIAWSRDHDACVACGTTEFPHDARGLCERCYGKSAFHKQAVRRWQHSDVGQAKFASIQDRYRSSSKGRLMILASGKRRQDRLVGLASDLSSLDLWIVFGAFGSRCTNCDATADLCIDHHRPLVAGHAISIDNAVVLCRSCNGRKKASSPETFYAPERLLAIEVAMRAASMLARVLQGERAA